MIIFMMQRTGGGSFTENDDDYIHQRYKRDRYDRDNELFDQRSAGKHGRDCSRLKNVIF